MRDGHHACMNVAHDESGIAGSRDSMPSRFGRRLAYLAERASGFAVSNSGAGPGQFSTFLVDGGR